MTFPPRPDMAEYDDMVIPPRGPGPSPRRTAVSFFLWGLAIGCGLAALIAGAMT
jgi:hypothetical protein